MNVGDAAQIDSRGLDALIGVLAGLGYDTLGPVVRDGAVMPGPVTGVADLPAGYHDRQAPGHYRLERGDDSTLFGWAVGPGSWKAEFFPPTQELWRATLDGEVTITEPELPSGPVAIVGARPCEVAALEVLDRVLGAGAVPDPHYGARREGAFVVTAECGTPASTCFCTSMGTGPHAVGGFDLALSELDDGDGHRFVVRVGTELGAEVLSRVPTGEASDSDLEARRHMLDAAEGAMTRVLPTDGLAALLARNLEHPQWDDVADRCLACGNCTLVCPTCFCSDVRDTSSLTGEVRRQRSWSSCFDLDHSYLHGGPVRPSTSSRYRQWLTHKLSTWWDQFGTSGCIGCGRCIAWCPVGIDLTAEVADIARSDGAVRAGAAPPGPSS
ncbi:MAG TPA: 4Fe-4S dicluster domain-containing protein [Acidimicrobiales bacterium]|nr:4Fe-4S dicluster domain-containing protein [Acidimicrobiales bacterium]HLN41242.1 4Fe-4S dicluster domain-containing protein [Acidimicrobiales bacterium]